MGEGSEINNYLAVRAGPGSKAFRAGVERHWISGWGFYGGFADSV
jgi:hypothetical protein